MNFNDFIYEKVLDYIKDLKVGENVQDKNNESECKVLEKYCQDLSKLASDGKLNPVIGRSEEIRRVIQIF